MATRRSLLVGAALLLSGCSHGEEAPSETATSSPTSTPTNSPSCSGQVVRTAAERVTLTKEQEQWTNPIEYENVSTQLQTLLDQLIAGEVERCHDRADPLETFIELVETRANQQAERYLNETDDSGLPLYVDTAYLSKADKLYAIFLQIDDVVVSSGAAKNEART